jgi:DNA-binding Lrp family transcriptional regulator
MFYPDFLQTPYQLYADSKMEPADRDVYAVVYWYEHLRDGKCTASNITIATLLGITTRAVQNSLTKLEDAGYIERIYKDVAKRNRESIKSKIAFKFVRTGGDRQVIERTVGDRHERTVGDQNKNSIEKKGIAAIAAVPFSLKEEIRKMEDHARRDLNIIALYFDERKPDIRTREQLSVAIRRHLRAAGQLKVFSDDQILAAVPKAKRQTDDWTIETLVKVLTK